MCTSCNNEFDSYYVVSNLSNPLMGISHGAPGTTTAMAATAAAVAAIAEMQSG